MQERITPYLKGIVLAAILFMAAPSGVVFGQVPATPQQPGGPPLSKTIPPSEVATKATETTNLLSAVSAKFALNSEAEKIRQLFDQASIEIKRELINSERILQGQPTLASLQAQQTLWKSKLLQFNTWLNLLTKRAVELREELGRLADLQATWVQTRETAQDSGAPIATL
jgi:hypothetical protein